MIAGVSTWDDAFSMPSQVGRLTTTSADIASPLGLDLSDLGAVEIAPARKDKIEEIAELLHQVAEAKVAVSQSI